MRVAVVGAGIAGLFAAYYLEREGAEVTIVEPGEPGGLSSHAAGIIEPTTAYRTNTLAFLRRVARLWRNRTCVYRRADGVWLLESLRQLERAPVAGSEATLLGLGRESMATYAALAEAHDDFGFDRRGLLERFDDPGHFEEERALAFSQASVAPVEERPPGSGAGALFFPEVAWLDTRRCVQRLLRELPRSEWVREAALAVSLDGTVTTRSGPRRFDAIALTSGVTSRSVGVPLTGVQGYGWSVRSPSPPETATIHVDRGIAVVPLASCLKVTGGWDFTLSSRPVGADRVLAAIRKVVEVDRVLDFSYGSRPTTPDGLPTVGRRGSVVVANGGFRLGWSYAPGMGRRAADLCLGRAANDPFLARFTGALRGGRLA
jgi:D-proline dehydrogenase